MLSLKLLIEQEKKVDFAVLVSPPCWELTSAWGEDLGSSVLPSSFILPFSFFFLYIFFIFKIFVLSLSCLCARQGLLLLLQVEPSAAPEHPGGAQPLPRSWGWRGHPQKFSLPPLHPPAAQEPPQPRPFPLFKKHSHSSDYVQCHTKALLATNPTGKGLLKFFPYILQEFYLFSSSFSIFKKNPLQIFSSTAVASLNP